MSDDPRYDLNRYDSVAELYDLFVQADYDVPFFRELTASVDGPVLELMSGTGRLSIPLIEAGTELTCIDGSQGMVDVLEQRLAERGLEATVLCRDVCNLGIDDRFDLAILPFQSLMELVHEDDRRRAMKQVHAVLRPGGRFVVTLHNPPIRRRMVDGTLRIVGRFPAPAGADGQGDGNLVVSGYETGGDPVVQRTQFLELYGPDGVLRWKRLQPMQFALVEAEEIERHAADVGFEVVEVFGDYAKSLLDPDRSPVMIWVLAC